MVSRSDIEAGGASMYVRLDASGFKEGVKRIQGQLKNVGKGAALGGEGLGKAVNIPITKSVQAASLVAAAHKRMSYALIDMGNKLAMTGWHWQSYGQGVLKWRRVVGENMARASGIIHSFGAGMGNWRGIVNKNITRAGGAISSFGTRITNWREIVGKGTRIASDKLYSFTRRMDDWERNVRGSIGKAGNAIRNFNMRKIDWRGVAGKSMVRIGGIMHNFGARMAKGGAGVHMGLDDSGFKEGMKRVQGQLKDIDKGAALGGKGLRKTPDIPIRKSVLAARVVRDVYSGIGMLREKMQLIPPRTLSEMYSFKKQVSSIGIAVRKFGNRIGILAGKLISLGKRFGQLSAQISSFGHQMAVAAIIMAMPFLAGAKVYASFSKEMAFVATMLDDTQAHMGGFTKGIRNLSVEFGESTATLSRGLYDILSAGFSAERGLEMLRITTMAAKAGMADAAQSTNAIISVLNSYSLSAEHAEYVADNLFTTVRYGVTTFAELSGHIGLVAASAAQMGVSLEELGASLAVITRGGVQTSAAVIALQNILKAFATPTGAGKEFAQQLKEAGLEIDMTIEGIKKYGFLDMMKAIGKLPTQHIMRLFREVRSSRGAMALKAGAANIDAIVRAHREGAGEMREAYEKVNKTFGFLLDRVKQAGLLILSYIGEALADSLKNVGERVIHVAKGFGVWAKQNKVLIVRVARSIGTFAGLALVLIAVGKAMAFFAAVTTLASGQWWVLAGAVGATMFMWQKVGSITGEVKKALNTMGEIGRRAMATAGDEVRTLEINIDNCKAMIAGLNSELHLLGSEEGTEERLGWKDVQYPSKKLFADPKWLHEYGHFNLEQLRLEQRRIIAQRNSYNIALRNMKLDLKKLKVAEKTALAMAAQENALKGMGRYRAGWTAGYWHTPTLAYAAVSKEDQQLDVLKGIRNNTGDSIPILEKIEKKIGAAT